MFLSGPVQFAWTSCSCLAAFSRACASISRGGAVVCDVNRKDQVDAMVAAAVERFGRVDALVNNAQTFRPQAPLATVTEDDVEDDSSDQGS